MRKLSRLGGGLAASLLVVVLTSACSGVLEAPPVEITYRDSLIGVGEIVRLTNQAETALSALEVRIENPNGDVKNYSTPSLAAGKTLELGWKKLDGFAVEVGAEISVRAEGFVLPASAVLALNAPAS